MPFSKGHPTLAQVKTILTPGESTEFIVVTSGIVSAHVYGEIPAFMFSFVSFLLFHFVSFLTVIKILNAWAGLLAETTDSGWCKKVPFRCVDYEHFFT
jgi:hypothetical protein